jgi:hypothetical protein
MASEGAGPQEKTKSYRIASCAVVEAAPRRAILWRYLLYRDAAHRTSSIVVILRFRGVAGAMGVDRPPLAFQRAEWMWHSAGPARRA